MTTSSFSAYQQQLYLRQIILPEIGEEGQEKLQKAKVLVVGAGGLGSSVLYYLVSAGIGNIVLFDYDKVELSNLNRQILHNHLNLQQEKVFSAKEKLLALNPSLNLTLINQKADFTNLIKAMSDCQIMVDATDNFNSRFLINSVSCYLEKPLVFGAVKAFNGHLALLKPNKKNPCYACFNPNIENIKQDLPLIEKGIIGATAGIIGAMQAMETIKYLLDLHLNVFNKMFIFDFLKQNQKSLLLQKNKNCPQCSLF
jgi:molybdopterin/thiamine biosynthesis adenylyltransferase